MESNEAVGQRIAKAREFLGLTQAVVAEKLGLARTTQVAIEQGRRPVSVAELYKYSEVLSRPLDYFLGLGVWGKADFRPHFRLMAEKLDASVVGPPRRPRAPLRTLDPAHALHAGARPGPPPRQPRRSNGRSSCSEEEGAHRDLLERVRSRPPHAQP